MPAPLLIVLPDPTEAAELASALGRSGLEHPVVALDPGAPPDRSSPAPGSWEAPWGAWIAQHAPGAVLVDPECEVDRLLDACARRPDAPAVLLLAGFATVREDLERARRGAFDTLHRPVRPEQIVLAVQRALADRALRLENQTLRRTLGQRFALGGLVTSDPKLLRIASIVDSIADTRAHVLIQGESGTGKSLLARAIHHRSSRADAPFIEVHCGALPEGLLESELFGHVRGAFTGAVRDKTGVFEAADGGTLFLDEIGTASPDLQVKLLRVLQEQRFERVGETRTREVDVRVVAATNVDLPRAVADGTFREDLFWRLNVIALELPPLRERPGDVALLAETFLERFAKDHGRPVEQLSTEALAHLVAHDWPGNVRELEHVVERAVLLARGPAIQADDLGPGLAGPVGEGAAGVQEPATADSALLTEDELAGPIRPLKQALAAPERRLIQRALRHTGGRRLEAAELLGITRSTLFNKMRKYGLLDPT